MPQQIRVLLADDVADLRTMVRIALEVDGRFRVVGEACDGMDGLEAIPEIHRLSPGSRILVLSGFDQRVGERAVALSADDYMPKTEHIESLAAKLLSVLRMAPKRLGQTPA